VIRTVLIALTAVTLAACKEEQAALPGPVEMTAEAVGYYCQMDLLEHDGPKGQVQLDGLPGALFFSQVVDTLAYLHMPEQNYAVVVAYVHDMSNGATWDAPGPWIPATEAIYVVGSDQMGGMGAAEFVPFSKEASALSFAKEHGGSLLRFDEITSAHLFFMPDIAPSADYADAISQRLRTLFRGSQG